MNFGKLNKRLTLKTVTLTEDGIGGYSELEVAKKTTWGSLRPLSAKEQLLYGMSVGSRTYECSMRYDSSYDVNRKYFIEWTDRYDVTRSFKVVSVIRINEAAHEIQLLLTERTEPYDTRYNDALLIEDETYYLTTEDGAYYLQQEF